MLWLEPTGLLVGVVCFGGGLVSNRTKILFFFIFDFFFLSDRIKICLTCNF